MTSTPPTQPPSSTTHAAHTLLSRAHPPTQATAIFTDKIKNKPLLLHPSDAPTRRALRRHTRAHKHRYHQQHRRTRPLSAREKRQLNLYELEPSQIKYDVYRGLNRLWNAYILEVLGFVRDGEVVGDAERRTVTAAGHGSLICGADFHGMEVEVVRCKDVGRVGLRGIVVRETKGTLVVVTAKDQVRTMLKTGAALRVEVELPGLAGGGVNPTDQKSRKLVFELHGEQLQIRPVDRAVRKFKWKTMDYL